jgi:hypothetical protein
MDRYTVYFIKRLSIATEKDFPESLLVWSYLLDSSKQQMPRPSCPPDQGCGKQPELLGIDQSKLINADILAQRKNLFRFEHRRKDRVCALIECAQTLIAFLAKDVPLPNTALRIVSVNCFPNFEIVEVLRVAAHSKEELLRDDVRATRGRRGLTQLAWRMGRWHRFIKLRKIRAMFARKIVVRSPSLSRATCHHPRSNVSRLHHVARLQAIPEIVDGRIHLAHRGTIARVAEDRLNQLFRGFHYSGD